MLRVSEVQISLYNAPNCPIVAFADVTIEDEITIHGILIVKTTKGDGTAKYTVNLPQKSMKDGRKKTIIFLHKKELYLEIVKQVLDYYLAIIDNNPLDDVNPHTASMESVTGGC